LLLWLCFRSPRLSCSGTVADQEQIATLEFLARFDIRFRWLIVAVWIIGSIVAMRVLPGLASLSQSNNAQFLPSSAPSQHAAGLSAPFQTTNTGATAVMVASRVDGPLSATDAAAIEQEEAAISDMAGGIAVPDQGVSADG